MKSLILLTLGLCFHLQLSGIHSYKKGESLFVWAKSGVIIRDTNNLNGARLDVVPYGEKIKVLGSKIYRYDEIAVNLIKPPKAKKKARNNEAKKFGYDLEGTFVKIKYKNVEGFVFDGFLSHWEAPKFITIGNKKVMESLEKYIKRKFLVLEKEEEYSDFNFDCALSKTIYSNQIIQENIACKTGLTRLIIPNFSIEEVMLFLNYSVFQPPTEYLICENQSSNEFQLKRIVITEKQSNFDITITAIRGIIIYEDEAWC